MALYVFSSQSMLSKSTRLLYGIYSQLQIHTMLYVVFEHAINSLFSNLLKCTKSVYMYMFLEIEIW